MNGPDLQFLAERAAGLEDRTTERLGDVHDRIAAVRRRRRAVAAAGVIGLVVALVVGLVFFDNDPGRKTPSPAPTPTAPFDPIGSAPARGTCWAVPPDVEQKVEDDWFDDSRAVPCGAPHTTETAGFLFLPDATVAEAKNSQDHCWGIVRGYLGVGPDSWIPWGFVAFLPSRAQVAEGATWLRCDAVFTSAWTRSFPGARTLTVAVDGIADDPPPELRACLDKPPTQEQPYVPCGEPHAYEQTGTLAVITGEEKYPSAAMRDGAAQEQCPKSVPEGVSGASVTAVWDPPETFAPWQELNGPCFIFHPDGTPLPPSTR
jgi:hypothetical protein